MHLGQQRKRIGYGIGLAFMMMAVCLIAYNAQSGCRPAAGGGSMLIARTQASCSILHPGSTRHPKPWVKIVVTHLISIAGKLAAS